MADVVKKHSVSSELAQKMVGAAVAKARKIGVTENVAILDDGGNLKAFGRMDGAPILCIEIAQNKAYTALFGVSTHELFDFIKGDPSLLAGLNSATCVTERLMPLPRPRGTAANRWNTSGSAVSVPRA